MTAVSWCYFSHLSKLFTKKNTILSRQLVGKQRNFRDENGWVWDDHATAIGWDKPVIRSDIHQPNIQKNHAMSGFSDNASLRGILE